MSIIAPVTGLKTSEQKTKPETHTVNKWSVKAVHVSLPAAVCFCIPVHQAYRAGVRSFIMTGISQKYLFIYFSPVRIRHASQGLCITVSGKITPSFTYCMFRHNTISRHVCSQYVYSSKGNLCTSPSDGRVFIVHAWLPH